jgi:hypothetical protein
MGQVVKTRPAISMYMQTEKPLTKQPHTAVDKIRYRWKMTDR